MIRHYCDCCERELERNYVSTRLEGDFVHMGTKVRYQVLLGVGAWNDGDLCRTCLRDILFAVLGAPAPTGSGEP